MEMDQFPMKSSKSEKFHETDDVTDGILSRKKRQAPYIIYPEILCIIDYDGYRWEFFFRFLNENLEITLWGSSPI